MAISVGIHAPYARNDVTTYALRLMEALKTSPEFSLSYSGTPYSTGTVDLRWDNKPEILRVSGRHEFRSWLSGLGVVVWTDLPSVHMRTAARIGCRNVWIPMIKRWTPKELDRAKPYIHHVFAPTVEQAIEISGVIAPSKVATLPAYSPTFGAVRKPQTGDPRIVGVVAEDGPASKRLPELCVDVALASCVNTRVWLQTNYAPSQRVKRRLDALTDASEYRLSVFRRGSYQEHLDFFGSCDVVVFASSRLQTPASVQDAISSGCLVVVPEVPVIPCLMQPGVHGFAFECLRPVRNSWADVVPEIGSMAECVNLLSRGSLDLSSLQMESAAQVWAHPTMFDRGVVRMFSELSVPTMVTISARGRGVGE